ncbi:hypothetical protein CIW49_11165 [Mycolicibacterium sp. P1-18]|uniref:hypothetical protein n=1 Tax=Mycolicibacterium sp. P1-18 TaxID=2024615 RepID=UPI0011F33DB7|nr:hypothetical protein [Mycolicibacterium sp. P1-18]KAA0098501.1 hypothetical protein CIW49_11165 [Mycolicibacterium sp. P1-18]
MNAATVDELHRLIHETLRCVAALEAIHGDTTAMRRVLNDARQIRNGVDRLEIDVADLCAHTAATALPVTVEMVQISDAGYAADFWRDVDHEGVGAQSLACVPAGSRRR